MGQGEALWGWDGEGEKILCLGCGGDGDKICPHVAL